VFKNARPLSFFSTPLILIIFAHVLKKKTEATFKVDRRRVGENGFHVTKIDSLTNRQKVDLEKGKLYITRRTMLVVPGLTFFKGIIYSNLDLLQICIRDVWFVVHDFYRSRRFLV
jgi:hypothetical protein